MDYYEVDRFMKDTGLASDPAYDNLRFLDEDIDQTLPNRKILGLSYFEPGRDSKGPIPAMTIQLPPDANKSTLLHELGHINGKYYYNDRSEEYAEAYRKALEERLGLPSMRVQSSHLAPRSEPAASTVPTDVPSTAFLVMSQDYPAATSYKGTVEQCTAKCTVALPDQLFSGVWEASQLVNTYEQQIVSTGQQPINIQVWQDNSPTFETEFYIIMKSTTVQMRTAAAQTIPWSLVIVAIVAIALAIIISYTIIRVIDFSAEHAATAIGMGVILLAAGGLGLIGLAIWKGTSVKKAVTGG